MTTEQRFKAAVNVIRNLPKNGSFQPSHDLQLKFYSYFKQASEGPCKIARPSFWDVTGIAKWRAWSKLGNMPKEAAMESYIEQLKSIVETMSYSASVEEFLASLGSFYRVMPAEEVEMVLGPVIEKVKSRANSRIASRDASPQHSAFNSGHDSHSEESETGAVIIKDSMLTQTSSDSSDDEDEIYTDPMESIVYIPSHSQTTTTPNGSINSLVGPWQSVVDKMQKDLDGINQRVSTLESTVANKAKVNKSFGLSSLSNGTIAFIILWPIAAHFLLSLTKNKRN